MLSQPNHACSNGAPRHQLTGLFQPELNMDVTLDITLKFDIIGDLYIMAREARIRCTCEDLDIIHQAFELSSIGGSGRTKNKFF